MPRHIRDTRPVTRKVTSAHGVDLVVTLAPEGLYVREAGRRTTFLLPYGVAHQQAVLAQVNAERRERAATRRPRVRRGLLR